MANKSELVEVEFNYVVIILLGEKMSDVEIIEDERNTIKQSLVMFLGQDAIGEGIPKDVYHLARTVEYMRGQMCMMRGDLKDGALTERYIDEVLDSVRNILNNAILGL